VNEPTLMSPTLMHMSATRPKVPELRLVVDLPNPRIDWSVPTWNEPALRFYRSLGTEPMDDWIGYRLSDGQLEALVADAPI
jgi:hypothetical protein